MTPREVHTTLEQAFEQLLTLRDSLDRLSSDTAYSIGLATTTISKAKALVGRDIDDQERTATGTGSAKETPP